MDGKFRFLGLAIAAMLFAWCAEAQESGKLTTISVATPIWEDQTHEDGTGLFFDIIRKVYEPSGIRMKFEIMPWKRCEEMIGANQADVIPAAYKDDPGGVYPKYPLYVDYTTAVFKKSRIKEWKGLQTLKEKNVIWLRGYNFHDVPALKALSLRWSEIDDYAQAWEMLKNDRVDAYLESLIDLERYIRKNKADMSTYQSEVLVAKNAYLKFSKSDKSKKLIEIYDKRIPELIASGELEALFKKWNVKFEPFKPEND
jgi:polar amino acid transport system substrate-binding protein